MIRQPFYLLHGIGFSVLAFYLYSIGTSWWWVGAIAFIALGGFNLATESPKLQKEDTVVRDTPGTQRYKTSIPQFRGVEIEKIANLILSIASNE